MPAVIVILALCLSVATRQSFVDTAPVNEGNLKIVFNGFHVSDPNRKLSLSSSPLPQLVIYVFN